MTETTGPEQASYGIINLSCTHPSCVTKTGRYRMTGGCHNCGAAPLIGLFTASHEASGGECPACGCRRLHWDRLAGPDEVGGPARSGEQAAQ